MNLDVVIVTYQSAPHLEAAVRSLPRDVRVIVIDNASADGSADLAQRLGCTVIRNDINTGFGRAVNRAVRDAVTAPRMLLLNPDASIAPESLSRLADALDRPGVRAAGPRLRDEDGHDQRPWWAFPSPRQAWTEAVGLHLRYPPDIAQSADIPFVVGACLLLDVAAFRAVGGFDERYWLYGEEADLCRRLTDAGGTVRYVAEAVAHHIGGASGESGSELVSEHFGRGADRFVLTHHGPAALVSFRVANLVGTCVRLPFLPKDDPRAVTRRFIARRLVHALSHHPTRVSEPDRSVAVPSLVVLSLEQWDDVWRRNQFLVRELTVRDPQLRVLFVEPAPDLLLETKRKRRIPIAMLRGRGRLRAVPENPQVLRYQPLKTLPRVLGRWSDVLLRRQIERAVARAELHDPVLWINDVDLTEVALRHTGAVVYDVTDDWLLARVPERVRRRRAAKERRLLDGADAVVVCSETLARSKGARRRVELIPNAVDAAFFTEPRARPADLPAGPVAVYVGTVHTDRVDIDLLTKCAEQLPTVAFVLVGPDHLDDDAHARVDELANIHRLGARPYGDVPAYLQHADVVIVPHVVTPFTESLDPIKAYECLAVGRPTLATPVAGFRDLGPPTQVVDASAFPTALLALLATPSPSRPVATLASWADRAEHFARVLAKARRNAEAMR